MYEYLEGEVAERSPARLVLDVGGVGYDLCVPVGARFADAGRQRVWTHLVVRDDAHLLYGFPDRRTRELFRALLHVRGVGPQMAIGILSGLSGDELLAAITADDPLPLTRARGVGKKTAQQILLDLRDRIDTLEVGPGGARAGAPPEEQASERLGDAVRALVSIGYSEKEARAQVERAAARAETEDLEELVRLALRS